MPRASLGTVWRRRDPAEGSREMPYHSMNTVFREMFSILLGWELMKLRTFFGVCGIEQGKVVCHILAVCICAMYGRNASCLDSDREGAVNVL